MEREEAFLAVELEQYHEEGFGANERLKYQHLLWVVDFCHDEKTAGSELPQGQHHAPLPPTATDRHWGAGQEGVFLPHTRGQVHAKDSLLYVCIALGTTTAPALLVAELGLPRNDQDV